MALKKGDRVHIRVFNPIISSIICRKVTFDAPNENQVELLLQDGSTMSVPAHTIHHIYQLNSAYKVHCTKNIECGRHVGVYKGRKAVGSLSFLAFSLDDVAPKKLSYFLEAHVTTSSYEEAAL